MPVASKIKGNYWITLLSRENLHPHKEVTTDPMNLAVGTFDIIGRITSPPTPGLIPAPISGSKLVENWRVELYNADGNLLAYQYAHAEVNPAKATLYILYPDSNIPAATGDRIKIVFIPPDDVYKFGGLTAAQSAVYLEWPEAWNPLGVH